MQRTDRDAARLNWPALLLGLVTLLPLLYVGGEVVRWIRDVPIWDEFDSALDFLIVLDAGAGFGEVAERLLAMANEHRTLVSRFIFAVMYWTTGGIDFGLLAVVGNLFLVGVFVPLLAQPMENTSRWRLAAIFALAVFQLQHHESLFWSGASIDHFFVVFAAALAFGALAVARRWSVPVASACALLASFSLAHGLLVWPIGAALLLVQGRRRETLWWGAAALAAGVAYFAGFEFNPGHQRPGLAELPRVVLYGLTLAGSSPALENQGSAPWWGAALVLLTVLVLRRGVRPHERLAAALLIWCLAAIAMIAWGRALLSGPWTPVTSRYIVLSSITWALLAWVLVERWLAPERRRRWILVPVVGALAGFNVAANASHRADGRIHAQNAEKAAYWFHQHGTFAGADAPPYPDPDRADALIREAEARGIYRLPRLHELTLTAVRPVPLDHAREIAGAEYFIDSIEESGGLLRIRGWAYRPPERIRTGDVGVVFRSAETVLGCEATPQLRPDVAAAAERADAIYSGFDLRIPRENLPAGEYGIGVCFDLQDSPEYMMTAERVKVEPGARSPKNAFMTRTGAP